MGQRANYIIKEGNKLTIHYNHWRANHIASDLYLGEKRFLRFVEECQINEVILNEPWIEGCVVIDKALRQLSFWAFSFPRETSVIEYCFSELAKKWSGWNIQFLKNKMYDVEKILGIDYISQQELQEPFTPSKETIINDEVGEWETAAVIIKQHDDLFVTKTGDLNIEGIVSYGEEIIPLLKDKPKYELPREEDAVTYECVVIDVSQKHLFVNDSVFGLWEQSKNLWDGYTITMSDYGYIEILNLAGIKNSQLRMPKEKVEEEFKAMITQVDNFDPHEMAERLVQENKGIEFNPDFFDNIQPKKTQLENFKLRIKKLLRLK
jgi:hypothetical protein